MEWSWTDGSKLQRQNGIGVLDIPNLTVAGQDPDHPCGVVRIYGAIDKEGLRITFQFEPDKTPGEGCCCEYGWIQHECTRLRWQYDNGTQPAHGFMRQGALSDPDKNPQGNDTGDLWDPNPWYGGSGDVKDDLAQNIKDTKTGADEDNALDDLDRDFERNPRPQKSIRDTPGRGGFITQLVCVESGQVMFQYRWVIFQPKGERQSKFVGAEGTNLTIKP